MFLIPESKVDNTFPEAQFQAEGYRFFVRTETNSAMESSYLQKIIAIKLQFALKFSALNSVFAIKKMTSFSQWWF